jgi:multidrug efflux pump subunit AcrB
MTDKIVIVADRVDMTQVSPEVLQVMNEALDTARAAGLNDKMRLLPVIVTQDNTEVYVVEPGDQVVAIDAAGERTVLAEVAPEATAEEEPEPE